jgi:hypothetical protein
LIRFTLHLHWAGCYMTAKEGPPLYPHPVIFHAFDLASIFATWFCKSLLSERDGKEKNRRCYSRACLLLCGVIVATPQRLPVTSGACHVGAQILCAP